MLEIIIVNDGTGKDGRGNYDYIVSVNGDPIATGHHRNHRRDKAWYHLVGAICDDLRIEEKRETAEREAREDTTWSVP